MNLLDYYVFKAIEATRYIFEMFSICIWIHITNITIMKIIFPNIYSLVARSFWMTGLIIKIATHYSNRNSNTIKYINYKLN